MTAIQHQTIAYEFATDAFDGSTEAPATDTPLGNQQFYGLPDGRQPALGIFPPNDPSNDEDASAAWGNRWLTWLELALDGPAPSGSRVEIYDPDNDRVLKTLSVFAGETTVYLQTGELLPQGSVIRILGGAAGVLRFHLTILDPQGLALLASLVINQQSNAAGLGGLIFSAAVASAAGTTDVELGEIQRYDATGLAGDALILRMPASPSKDDRCGIKEVGDSAVTVIVDGNGAAVESPTAAPAASYSVGIARQSLTFQYDGSAWRIV